MILWLVWDYYSTVNIGNALLPIYLFLQYFSPMNSLENVLLNANKKIQLGSGVDPMVRIGI